VHNNMRIAVMWSKSKLEVEFLYVKQLFFKNGSRKSRYVVIFPQ